MANEVAALNAYHNGANYSISRLYDGEINIFSPVETKVLLHFDTDNGVIDECGGTWTAYTDRDATNPTTDIYVDTTYAKFDYALQIRKSPYFLQRDTGIILGGRDFTIECWGRCPEISNLTCFIRGFGLALQTPTSSDDPVYMTAGFNFMWSSQQIRHSKNSVFRMMNRITYPPNQPTGIFHFGLCYKHSTKSLHAFCNGALRNQPAANSNFVEGLEKPVYFPIVRCGHGIYAASTYTERTNNYVTISELRIIDGVALYTATDELVTTTNTYVIPTEPATLMNAVIPVEGNVAFKSANGTLYAPLSSDATYKTPPCLNVRHNGTNYFAIK